ncbi:hypothetical protein GBAR_LOCUS1716 [Geodia barretti]|uniref:Uncharacterized protein n=1 Tax=Geodia barretti TaxID=519541 RepID=A0AA35QX48_GEOBA|nr:hypothetical protein GBAR_LOCUS1716 [Geodia barretti]
MVDPYYNHFPPLMNIYQYPHTHYMPCIAQFSGEELHELKEGAWENPAYDNMDQLMDERFSFLDFTEYTSSETASMDSGIISGRSLELPLGSPVRRKSEGLVGGQSPLVRSTHSMMACSPVEPWKPLSSSALHLSNGLLDNAHLKTHSRTASSGSSIISDGLPSPRPTDSSLLPAITTIQHS